MGIGDPLTAMRDSFWGFFVSVAEGDTMLTSAPVSTRKWFLEALLKISKRYDLPAERLFTDCWTAFDRLVRFPV